MTASPPASPGSLLTINAGSSSVKVALYTVSGAERAYVAGEVERIGSDRACMRIANGEGSVLVEQAVDAQDHERGLRKLVDWLRSNGFDDVRAAGHRVVHGGADHVAPEAMTPALLTDLRALVDVDPDHLPSGLACIDEITRTYPSIPQFACFDTAFHRSMPWVAQAYALPSSDRRLRRYGFHGLSCEYIVGALARLSPDAVNGRLIVAHLGNGASMTAIRDGRSMDTTMGFSPTGGLVMSTRCGDLDPAVLLYIMTRVRAMPAERLRTLVNKESGLLAVSGISADMRDLLEREASDEAAGRAVALFCYSARKFLGSLVAVLGGLDTLVFTGGIGEHAAAIRARICAEMNALGIELDGSRNAAHAAIISTATSRVTVRVMHTDEDLVIARHVRQLLARRE